MRPKTTKKTHCCPMAKLFQPCGCLNKNSVCLSKEEIEALNLKNVQGLDQVEAAKSMNTSQSTFQRILTSAYKKVSDALINGKEIKLD